MNDTQRRTIASLSLTGAAALLDRKEVSSVELTELMLRRAGDNRSNAFITINEGALKAAAAADGRRKAGLPLSPIDGVPMALKDDYCVKGMKMTCASRMLADFIPPYSATVAEKLENAGFREAVIREDK